tara:strand:- start:6551 stop:7519 length:969 start_codon:yes stop_codon:yes gene_type:complete
MAITVDENNNIIADNVPVVEFDVLNRLIIMLSTDSRMTVRGGIEISPRFKLSQEGLERFLTEQVGSFWHDPENDKLEHITFYSNVGALVQRRKIKYDFATGTTSWVSYTFTGYTQQQLDDLKEIIMTYANVEDLLRQEQIEAGVQRVAHENLFFENLAAKREKERNYMLNSSDWRVLPDVETSNKDMWIRWRQEMRSLPAFTDTHEDNLALFKAFKNLKWPIDPKVFFKLYPDGLDVDGNAVEYLATDDQWVEREFDASTDFVKTRLGNVLEWRERSTESRKRVSSEVLELAKLLRIEDFVENGIDYTTFVIEEDLDDLAAE